MSDQPKKKSTPAMTDVQRAQKYRKSIKNRGGIRTTLQPEEVKLICEELRATPEAAKLVKRLEDAYARHELKLMGIT